MKIRTQETVTKYETWEYELPDDFELPFAFHGMNGEDKYNYLMQLPFPYDANMRDSDWSGLGTIDEYEIVE